MAIEVLKKELSKIKSRSIKAFTEEALSKVDPKFWEAPCSSTGKHHPPEDQGKGGLVRHIKKGNVVVEEFGRRAKFIQLEFDMAHCAYDLHDICKNGIPWGVCTDYTHGYLASEWLKQFKLSNEAVKQTIIDAVRYHMAPWCYVVNPFEDRAYTGEEMRRNLEELSRALLYPTRIELAVREADFWASREGMSFLPGKLAVYDSRVHDTPKAWIEEVAKEYGFEINKKITYKVQLIQRKG